jgi:hypothetical protein
VTMNDVSEMQGDEKKQEFTDHGQRTSRYVVHESKKESKK